MKYSLVVLDLDGTLLNDDHKISEKNKDAILHLKKHDVQFMLASGRPHASILPYARELDLELPIISLNGAMVKSPSSDEVYVSSSIPTKEVAKILSHAKKSDFLVSLYSEDKIFTYEDELLNLHSSLEGLKAEKIDEFPEGQQINKILMVNDPEKVSQTMEQLELDYKNQLYITSSEPEFLEVMNRNVSKGIALIHVLKKLKRTNEEVAAFGNNYNDVSMFVVAGLSVVMDNSPPQVKEEANYVTKSNTEHGVAYALKRVFKEVLLNDDGEDKKHRTR